jgi:hypothetical protein
MVIFSYIHGLILDSVIQKVQRTHWRAHWIHNTVTRAVDKPADIVNAAGTCRHSRAGKEDKQDDNVIVHIV